MNKRIDIFLFFSFFALVSSNYIEYPDLGSDVIPRLLLDQNYNYTEIHQNVNLSQCKIKGGSIALYICKNNSFIITGKGFSNKFSTPISQLGSIVDGDIDSANAAVIQSSQVRIFLLNYQQGPYNIDLKGETPFLVRVKTRPNYILITTISKTSPSKKNETNETQEIQETPDSDKFVMHTFMLGIVFNFHNLKLNSSISGIEISQKSFIDMVYIDDLFERREYVVIAMEPNILMTYRSFFQDSEMEFVNSIPLSENIKIMGIASETNHLFILTQDTTNGNLKILIYRTMTYFIFEIVLQCELVLEQQIIDGYIPEIKVKRLESTYFLLVNFPNQGIITYYLRSTFPLNLTSECPIQGIYVNYSDYGIKGRYGYSFEFTSNLPTETGNEHGILLSPFNTDQTGSLFIEYCFPNHFWVEDVGCFPCEKSESKGGPFPPLSICEPCRLSNGQTLARHSPPDGGCVYQCKEVDKFGPNCQLCEDWLGSTHTTPPRNSIWGLDDQNHCGFLCQSGYSDNSLGMCLEETDKHIAEDPCRQISDCKNCSLSYTCGWCEGSCQNLKNCQGKTAKSRFWNDFAEPALNCSYDPSEIDNSTCGNKIFTNLTGIIQFQDSIIPKNQFCSWEITPAKTSIHQVELRISVNNYLKDELDAPAMLWVSCCGIKRDKSKSCSTELFWVRSENWTLGCQASYVYLLFWNKQMRTHESTFSVEYSFKERTDQVLMTMMEAMVKWIFNWLFITTLIIAIVSTVAKLRSRQRRARLLIELQRINAPDEDGETIEPINVEEFMENERIVTRMTYDGTMTNEFQQTDCPICLETFQQGENLAKFQCKHIFHIKCFEDWVKTDLYQPHVKCPICNRALT